jgi:hypothetical protein
VLVGVLVAPIVQGRGQTIVAVLLVPLASGQGGGHVGVVPVAVPVEQGGGQTGCGWAPLVVVVLMTQDTPSPALGSRTCAWEYPRMAHRAMASAANWGV